ncbi:MAG: hypothetical protein VB064_08245 [Oscillospiraceae bacterium]|nr:hypothetical protein [Oscillospiraceae bacterium]
MIFPGVMINTGPWDKVSSAEKRHLKDQIPMLNMCGLPILGPYFRKVNDDITIVFEDSYFERACRGIDWGVLYPLDFVFGDSDTSQSLDDEIPTTFILKPDLNYFEFYDLLREKEIIITAIYKKEHFFQSLPAENIWYDIQAENGVFIMEYFYNNKEINQ